MSVADVLNRLFCNVAVMKFECFLRWSLFVFLLYFAVGVGLFSALERLVGLDNKTYWWDTVTAIACIT